MSITIIPRFLGGSFSFVGELLCKFLIEKGYNCEIRSIEKSLTNMNKNTIIFIGNINDSSLLRALPVSIFSRRRIFYAVTEGPYYGYLRGLSRMFDIIVPSHYVYSELKSSGIRVCDIIPHGIDIEDFNIDHNARENHVIQKVLRLREHGYVILLSVISENIPRKGLAYLYEALRYVKTGKRFILVLKGYVEPPSALLDKVLVVKEFLPRHVLIELYKLADVVVVPSLAEGFGLPIIEAFN